MNARTMLATMACVLGAAAGGLGLWAWRVPSSDAVETQRRIESLKVEIESIEREVAPRRAEAEAHAARARDMDAEKERMEAEGESIRKALNDQVPQETKARAATSAVQTAQATFVTLLNSGLGPPERPDDWRKKTVEALASEFARLRADPATAPSLDTALMIGSRTLRFDPQASLRAFDWAMGQPEYANVDELQRWQVMMDRAHALTAVGRVDDAMKLAKELAAIVEPVTEEPEAEGRRAEQRLRSAKAQLAAAHEMLSNLAAASGDASTQEQLLRKRYGAARAGTDFSAPFRIGLELAELLVAQKRLDEAGDILDELIRTDAPLTQRGLHDRVRVAAARLTWRRGLHAESLQMVDQLWRPGARAPLRDFESCAMLASFFSELGRYDDADAILWQTMSDPGWPLTWESMRAAADLASSNLERAGRPEEAAVYRRWLARTAKPGWEAPNSLPTLKPSKS